MYELAIDQLQVIDIAILAFEGKVIFSAVVNSRRVRGRRMHKNEIEVGIHRCVQGAFEYAVVTDRVLSALTGCDYLIKESDSLNNRNCRLLQQRDCADQALRVREHAGFK